MFVNWLPVICIPSPESPAKRMTALSSVSRRRGGAAVVAMLLVSGRENGGRVFGPRMVRVYRQKAGSPPSASPDRTTPAQWNGARREARPRRSSSLASRSASAAGRPARMRV